MHYITSWNDSTANHLSNELIKASLWCMCLFLTDNINLLGEVVCLRLKVPFARYSACSLKSDTCIKEKLKCVGSCTANISP